MPNLLRVLPLAERRRARDVAKEHGHGLADFVRRQCGDSRRQRSAAVAAKAELRRVLLVALGTVDHPGIDDLPGHNGRSFAADVR